MRADALLWVAAAVVILGGYALLAAGRTDEPTFLLSIGYLILLPLAIRGVGTRLERPK